MSDSLRDQLMQAGFDAPKEPVRSKRAPSGKSPRGGSKSGKSQGGADGRRQSKPRPTQNPAHAAKTNRRAATTPTAAAPDAEAIRRKAIKAEIKTLIEAAAIKEYQGESVYRFILNKRIRELHVKDDIRQQLVAGTLIITRLNGTTWLVPDETSTAIRALNPDWAVVTPAPDGPEDNTGYEDFPVPDDLQW
ncbi:DUF2058 domain-containing protein [Granulosicoccus antarcticus]|uniref:Nucleoprotein/polynucleotide-associated enzyme n=1 Tax=Granulosicoccus antarcticus IMCC3135 TaxID=1192854 RepID=A0A2Z2NU63_9GAMM|nr:DUF2058 family protein [Granulosicoccus antarcticus]ASJ75036.1 hypothetical protein IMCC3135_24860 [Granulosicoccus antarcticus IMCC3135]